MTRPVTELDDALRAWARALGDDAERLMRDVGDAALRHSQPRTPVDTGELLGSESVRLEGARAFLQATAAHAEPVHEGTRFMAARPYFNEGIQDAVPDMMSAVKGWAEDNFERVMK